MINGMDVFLVLAIIFFLHWLGDFYLQTRWMANNKSKNMLALLTHGIVYTFVLAAGTIFLIPNTTPIYKDIWVTWIILNGIFHILIDSITSKITSYYYAQEKYKKFFDTVGLDQLLHVLTILGFTRLLLV